MLDQVDYTTEIDHHQGNGNGYDHLDGDWALFYKVASGFTHRVKPEDRQDFLHDAILAMAQVKVKYELIGKPLTEAGLIRVACYEVAEYWRKWFKRNNGHDCGQCSREQRQKCRSEDLYGECPKAVKLDSLDRLIEDGEGNKIELYQMIADDNAVDIVAMLDAKFTIQSYPRQAVLIAYKRYAGYPLDSREQNYLSRFRKRIRQRLFA
jgi:hypothetical protein